MNPLIRGPVTAVEPAAKTGTLCDFCALWLGGRYTLFGARRFSRNYEQISVMWVLSGNWAACVECAPLVRDRQWSRVLNRAMDTHRSLRPGDSDERNSMVRADLAGMFLQLERHLTGEEVEVGEAA